MSPSIRSLCALAFGLLLVQLGGCGGTRVAASPAPPAASGPLTPKTTATQIDSSGDQSAAKVPVTAEDPSWGHPDAPVTIVEFTDYECPFCARVRPTLEQIKGKYGPNKVRLVTRHNPLPFHRQANPAAIAAAAVFQLAGAKAFYQFSALAFEHQRELSEENYVIWAAACGVDEQAFRKAVAGARVQQKVDADKALAKRLGATGTPAFRINGVTLVGAQPFEKFAEIIDNQLLEADKLVKNGTAPRDVYVALTNRNVGELAPEAGRDTDTPDVKPDPPLEDTKVYRVPVLADDPALGPSNALVTIVSFSDFQCPFCKRVEETLKQVRERYGDNVRIVWKDQPLPFHTQAMPSAVLARLVYSKNGNQAFWSIHDELFASQPDLGNQKLQSLAKKFGVSWGTVEAEVKRGRILSRIEESSSLADDFHARGTPHFFINGIRLSGAQPFEKFQARIDSELEKAKALQATGVRPARIYEELTKIGEGPPEPQRKVAPLPAAGRPSRGPANAAVVIQEWSDFQCPFCKRIEPTLEALLKEFPTQVRLTWRHMPLPFHDKARLAAEAAEEALAQRGNQAFWKYHDKLLEAQSEPGGLDEPNLVKIAGNLGLDTVRFQSALNHREHSGLIDADNKLGHSLDINGTPSFVINGYFLSGAQPIGEFRRIIKRAIADAKSKPAKATATRDAPPDTRVLEATREAAPAAAPANAVHHSTEGLNGPTPDTIPAPTDVAQVPKDAIRTTSGLASKVLKKGNGREHPTLNDKVVTHYSGWTTDGKMFDSSVTRGAPATFGVSDVIPGWTEALQLMVKGEKLRVWMPAKLAYGEHPSMPGAPAGDLVFDVELLEITKLPASPQTPTDVKAPPANARRTASGLAYRIIQRGTGITHPAETSHVKVHYSGWTTDGKLFDSSVTRGEPAQFGLRQVIKGWTEGVQLMVVGEKTRFWIPAELAYGEKPTRPGAPAGVLVFDIELLGIE